MLDTLRSVMRFRALSLDPVERRLGRVANVDDLRRIARRRLPGGVFDYIDGAAEDEVAAVRNRAGFADLEFRPRVLRDVDRVDPATTVLGRPIPIPLILSPTGFGRIADPQGELAVCRAAARAGLPYTLSTMATRSLEEVAAAQSSIDSGARRWFQVYVWKDRGLVAALLERARAAGYEAIMITVDTAVLGRRERDVRRGFTMPPQLGLDTVLDGIRHPGWTWSFVRNEPIRFANVVGTDSDDGADPVTLSEHVHRQFSQALSWDDLDWFRAHWDGPIIIKGIQCVADARLAAERGVDAIALSNHGGRQLDAAPSPIELVAPVVDAVGDTVEVYCDGGVRRGSDICKAAALGATACMIGRAYFYALGAAGERGVDWVLDFFDAGLRQTMALTGIDSIDAASRELVHCRHPDRGGS